MADKIVLNTEKLQKEKKIKRIFKIILIIIILILLLLYVVVGIVYNRGNFSIALDANLYFNKGLIIYDDPEYKVYRSELYAKAPDTFDNISYKWLPDDITEYNGSHNGDNYLAYSFYVENTGVEVADYWSEIVIDDIIKNVDEAVRIRIYKNDEVITYAKPNANGIFENGTIAFKDDETVGLDHVENFMPGDINKYTIVLWLEGSDPDCTDNILGGEFKVHMDFNSEHVDE